MGIETDIVPEIAFRAKLQLKRTLTQRYIDAVADITGPGDVVVRDIQPGIDLESGEDNGWNGDDDVWTQDLTGGTANAWNEAYTINSGEDAEGKIIGFAALQLQAADTPTHAVRFVRGTGGSQGFAEEAHIQQAFNDDEGEGYFNDAVLYGLTADGAIEHYIDETATDTVVYIGGVAEEVGENLASATNPMLSGGLDELADTLNPNIQVGGGQ